MSILVRLRVPYGQFPAGADLALAPDVAKMLQDQKKAWVTGGDATEMEAVGVVTDSDVGPPYEPPATAPDQAEASVNTSDRRGAATEG